MRGVHFGLLALLCGCSSSQMDRWLTVTVAALPGRAAALEIQPVLGQTLVGGVQQYGDLGLAPARGETSLLLRLPLDASGQLTIAAAARDGKGCVIATGLSQVALTRSVLSAEMRVALLPVTGKDVVCKAGGPVLNAIELPAGLAGPLPSKGGTEIFIRGFGFHPQASVTIGGAVPDGVQWRSPLELSLFSPPLPGKIGPQELTVTNPDGAQTMRKDLLKTYLSQVQFEAPMQTLLGPEYPSVSYTALLLVDVNEDGRRDLVTHFIDDTMSRHYLSVSLSTADPKAPFARESQYYLLGRSRTDSVTNPTLHAADINRDGKIDLLFATPFACVPTCYRPIIQVLLNQGGGTFASDGGIAVGAPDGVSQLATGDLNGDGWPDLLAATSLGTFYWYLNQSGTLVGRPEFTRLADNLADVDVAIADLDQDGADDILSISRDVPLLRLFMGAGGGKPPSQPIVQALPAGFRPTWMRRGDLDGDGRLDLLITDHLNGKLLSLRHLGKGFFSPGPLYILPASAFHLPVLGDLNGDGLADIVSPFVINLQRRVDIALGKREGGFESIGQFADVVRTSGAAILDVDGDGRLDVVGLTTSAKGPGTYLSILRSIAQ